MAEYKTPKKTKGLPPREQLGMMDVDTAEDYVSPPGPPAEQRAGYRGPDPLKGPKEDPSKYIQDPGAASEWLRDRMPSAPPSVGGIPVDTGINSAFIGDPTNRADVAGAISRSAAGAPQIDAGFMGTARDLAMGRGGQASAQVQAAREQALRDIMSQRAGGRNAALAQVGATRALGTAEGQLAQQAMQAGLAEQKMGLEAGAGMATAQAQIEADLERAANEMLARLLDQGVSLEVAQMQVEAERTRQRTQLMYEYWSQVQEDKLARDITGLQEDVVGDISKASASMPGGVGWAPTQEPVMAWNPVTHRYEQVNTAANTGPYYDDESANTGPYYDDQETSTYRAPEYGVSDEAMYNVLPEHLKKNIDAEKLDMESKLAGVETANSILGGINRAAQIGGLAKGLAGDRREREGALKTAAYGAGRGAGEEAIRQISEEAARGMTGAMSFGGAFGGPMAGASTMAQETAGQMAGAAIPTVSMAAQGANILASNERDAVKKQQATQALGTTAGGYAGGKLGAAAGTAMGGPVGGVFGGALGAAAGAGLTAAGLDKWLPQPAPRQYNFGAPSHQPEALANIAALQDRLRRNR